MFMLNHLTGFGAGGRPFAGVTAASATLSGNNGGAGFTYRTVLAPGAISSYGDFCRLVWQSGSSGAGVTLKSTIGILSGTYGFAATPTNITQSGNASWSISGASTEGSSDILSFPIDPSQSYVIATYISGGGSGAQQTGLPTGWTQYYLNADDVTNTSPSGYTSNTNIMALKRLEV